ncbi:hypothetical protein DPMN_117962 [Dreissena polymorpha]|uniref:Uncharacterized protein n=1 Tax=Dreissena polymorpha TaxID=45954 RepID=A0A9D4GJ69_DREPO|nr:hypothetical protein DPMN_117962 [Dreissena polymorpha]
METLLWENSRIHTNIINLQEYAFVSLAGPALVAIRSVQNMATSVRALISVFVHMNWDGKDLCVIFQAALENIIWTAVAEVSPL